MVVIANKNKDYYAEDEIIDMTKEMWEDFYKKAMGGFESLGDEDSFSEEEEHPKEDLTKNGYLKDGFVVDDDLEIESEEEEDFIPDCDDITSESSEVSMTQEELEAAYGCDSEDEEKEKKDEDEDEDEDEDDEEYEDEDESDSELEEESYIYK